MQSRAGVAAVIAAVIIAVPVAFAHATAKPPAPPLLPKPKISASRALSIAARDVQLHGPLAGNGGYISGVDYGRFRKLSSGGTARGVGPGALVWAITYTDPSTHSKARQVISASNGKVLTRVYYAPGLP